MLDLFSSKVNSLTSHSYATIFAEKVRLNNLRYGSVFFLLFYLVYLQYHILKNIDGVSSETMLLLWSMKERQNSNSKFKLYFDTLPLEFNTGVPFCCNMFAVNVSPK